MLNEDLLARTQVAHLFLKAADQGVISPDTASDVLNGLFETLTKPFFSPAAVPETVIQPPLNTELHRAAVKVCSAADKDAQGAHYSLNMRSALDDLKRAVVR